MMKRKSIPILLLVILGMVFISQPCLAKSQDLTIVFSGDMRGEIENCHCPKEDFGGLPRRSKYITEVKKQTDNILLLDVGDVLPLLAPGFDRREVSDKAFISFKAMDMMGYDAMNVGESDIVLGREFLERKAFNASFPFISSNIVDRYTGEPFFKPYVIKTMKNGLRIGILGLVNERYVINSDTLDIAPNKEMALRFIPEVRSRSDIVIVMAHLGLPYSIELAKSVKGIDVILSGHWDIKSQEPMKIGNTLLMPTIYHSRKIGRLDMKVENKRIYSYEWESTPLDAGYDGDKIMERLISRMPDLKKTAPSVDSLYVNRLAAERPLKVFVFYSPGCRACMEVEKNVLPGLRDKYGDKIVLEHLDVSILKNYEEMARLEKLYGVKDGGYVPEAIVSRYVLMGKEDIMSRLDEVIQRALDEPAGIKKNEDFELGAAEYHPPEGSLVLSRFRSFNILAVMTAGLLDGVNPCAFTTIVFFISFLAFAGYGKREMFLAGSSFTIAVFITYLLIGLGIFRLLRSLRAFGYVANFVNLTIGVLAFLLGALSLIDYLRFRGTGDTKSTILKLPQSVKNRIHSVIGSGFRSGRGERKKRFFKIIWVAFTAGFMVSILESFCTGQVYLPTIAFVLKMSEKKMSAWLYLVLYNTVFIIPLIVVFLLGLLGAASRTFSRFIEKHLGAVKLFTAALFFILGAVLIIFR